MMLEYKIFTNTRKTFLEIGTLSTQKKKRIYWIFAIVLVLSNIDILLQRSSEYEMPFLLAFFLGVIVGGSFIFLILMYVLPHLLWRLGRALKGKASVSEARLVLAYSSLPSLVVILFSIFFSANDLFASVEPWLMPIVKWTLVLLSAKVGVEGLRCFNQYSYFKALINYSLLFIPYLLSLLI